VAILSVGFDFTADVTADAGRSLEIRWVAGEPKDLVLRYELHALPGGRETVVQVSARFDVMSLGWLVKFFLRHHPEIQLGIFPGVALGLWHPLVGAVARAA
jgi:hypothetical protein